MTLTVEHVRGALVRHFWCFVTKTKPNLGHLVVSDPFQNRHLVGGPRPGLHPEGPFHRHHPNRHMSVGGARNAVETVGEFDGHYDGVFGAARAETHPNIVVR